MHSKIYSKGRKRVKKLMKRYLKVSNFKNMISIQDRNQKYENLMKSHYDIGENIK